MPSGTAVIRNLPRQECELECLLQDHNYLVTQKYGDHDVLRSACNGRWTYYSTAGTMAWISGLAQSPSRSPCDPRSVGLPTDLFPIEWYLADSRVLLASRGKLAEDEEMVLVTVADEKRGTIDFVFDPLQQFMPVRITRRGTDKLVDVDTTIKYQVIEGNDGKAFFLDQAVQVFHEQAAGVEPDSIAIRKTWTVTECDILPNALGENSFAVAIPAGVSVSDTVAGTFTSGKTEDVSEEVIASNVSRWRIFVVVASLAAIVFVVFLVVRGSRQTVLGKRNAR